ncbi:MAG: hypothetical protein IPH78_01245 [Bacteroidetes bacterium]|nr:hypothetical protein [Bacteroidota bacterium]
MILWQMLQGLRNILLHHLQDAVNDVKSGANNLATNFGPSKVEHCTLVIAPIEALVCFVFFYMVSPALLLWLAVAFVVVWLLRFLLTLNDGHKFYTDINKQNITLWILNGFYEQIMPPIAILYYMHLRSYEGLIIFAVMALYFLVFPVFVANFISHITSTTIAKTKILLYDMPKSYLVTTYWKLVTWYWTQYTAYWKRQHERNPNIRYNFCTISSTDHLYKVMVLHDSLIQQSSKARLHVLLTDTGIVDYTKFPDSVIFYMLTQVKSQPHAELILSKYASDKDRVRWCMKPVFMRFLLSKRLVDSVIYIDNDICFFNEFISLFDYVGRFGVWLTPHWRCMNPFEDSHVFTDSFTDGMFNAGFVGATAAGLNILEWWAMVNSHRCEKNRAEGMWDDQKYLDMLPVRFSNVGIVRHMGCNVAVWNKRDCIRTPHISGVRICSEFPIVFIHFTNDTIEDIRADKYGGDPLLKPYLSQYQERIEYYKILIE